MLEAWKLVTRGTAGEVQSPKPKDLEVGCLKVGTQGPFRKGQVWVIYSRMYENATVKLVHMPSLKSWEIRKVHEFAFLHPIGILYILNKAYSLSWVQIFFTQLLVYSLLSAENTLMEHFIL